MTASAKRRQFAFSLRALFLVTAVLALWLGHEVKLVRDRKAARKWVESIGHSAVGLDDPAATFWNPNPTDISFWRRWMGDKAVAFIGLPLDVSQQDEQRVRALFPEATIGHVI